MLRLLAATAFLLAAGSGTAHAQDPQSCPADQAVCAVANGQILNRVINGDTTATGDRIREDRIYQLQRNSLYLMNGDVRNNGYHLRIYGAEGDGAMPQVYTTLNPDDGNRVGDPFGQEGHITFRNFVLSGVLPSSPLANVSNRVVRVRQPGFDLVMDRFVAVNFQANIIRAQAALRKLEVTNSLWANSGWLGDNGTNFGAGSGADLRDGSLDSLIMRNNTFINYTDRIIRHRSSTAPVQHMIFDHNTIINAVSYHGTLALGEVGEDVQITNNLFYDSFVAGEDSSDVVRQEEFNESGEVYDSNGQAKMAWIQTVPNDITDWNVSANGYVVTDAVETFYQTFGDGGGDDGNPDNGTDGDNDIMGPGDPLTAHIMSRISNPSTAFMEFDFDLSNAPDAPVNMVTWYRTETGRTKETLTFDPATDDYDRRDVQYFLNDFDASYPTTNAAYTAAAGGCPLGDLNWFPDRYDACDGIVAAEQIGDVVAGYALDQNFPNPFSAETRFTYDVPAATAVTLAVYDLLGREVARVVDHEQHAPGRYGVTWNAARDSGQPLASGVYVYQLRTADTVLSKRFVVVR